MVWAGLRARARRRARLRYELAVLYDRVFRDAGVRREELVREALRPFWEQEGD